jgi:hypothetical protein
VSVRPIGTTACAPHPRRPRAAQRLSRRTAELGRSWLYTAHERDEGPAARARG